MPNLQNKPSTSATAFETTTVSPCIRRPSTTCSAKRVANRGEQRTASNHQVLHTDRLLQWVLIRELLFLRRKQKELAEHLSAYDDDVVEERLATALHAENPNPHRLAQLMSSIKMAKVSSPLTNQRVLHLPHQGRPVLIFELHRSLLQENGEVDNLETLAQRLEMASADCLCLSTDRSSSDGLKDLFTVSRSVKIPVLARDWYIHPLQVRIPVPSPFGDRKLSCQILEAKEAGASGVIGVIACVSIHGTPLLSSFAAAIGIDAPVEVPVHSAHSFLSTSRYLVGSESP